MLFSRSSDLNQKNHQLRQSESAWVASTEKSPGDFWEMTHDIIDFLEGNYKVFSIIKHQFDHQMFSLTTIFVHLSPNNIFDKVWL